MAKSLIRCFFSHEELVTCGVGTAKKGKPDRPKPDLVKMKNLIGKTSHMHGMLIYTAGTQLTSFRFRCGNISGKAMGV